MNCSLVGEKENRSHQASPDVPDLSDQSIAWSGNWSQRRSAENKVNRVEFDVPDLSRGYGGSAPAGSQMEAGPVMEVDAVSVWWGMPLY